MPFILLNDQPILYIHVPRTGGSTIENWMRTLAPLRFHSVGVPAPLKCTPQHLQMKDFRALFGDDFFKKAFMTVRDPYERIASEYRLRAVIGGNGFWKAFPSFSLWLDMALSEAKRSPYHLDNHLRPQWEFTGSGVEILKFEIGIEAITSRIADSIGVPAPKIDERVFETRTAGINVPWDSSDRLRVQEFYRKDFELFEYKM